MNCGSQRLRATPQILPVALLAPSRRSHGCPNSVVRSGRIALRSQGLRVNTPDAQQDSGAGAFGGEPLPAALRRVTRSDLLAGPAARRPVRIRLF